MTTATIRKAPKHIAVIMDGNGRWAENQGKHRVSGHKHGVKSLRKVIAFANEQSIQILTIFAFSSENWKRPEKEVSMLMELFFTVLGGEVKKMHKHNIKLKVVGDLSGFTTRLRNKIADAESLTAENTGLLLNVAANYGGRWDIACATKLIAQKVADNELELQDINEDVMDVAMRQGGLCDVDLMIRTGGDVRVSNFLLWQMAYAELYFTDILWPDFDKEAFQDALDFFAGKERRFGKTSEQVSQP